MPIDVAVGPVTALLTLGHAAILRGWCQNVYIRGELVCPLKALGVDHNTELSKEPAICAAIRFLEQATHWHDISQWNDEPERTKEQVLAAFVTAIGFAREIGA